MNKTTRNMIVLAVLATLLIIVIGMSMSGDVNPTEVRPVAEGSVQPPGSGVRIGSK